MSDAIAKAVDRAARRRPKAVVLEEQTIAIAQQPIVVRGDGELAITRGVGADPSTPNVLVWDPKISAWRAVLLPPGTSWELVARRQGPTIWKPGMRT